jgi:hypothetical protein
MTDWRPEANPETESFERDVFRTAPASLFPRGRDAYVIGTGPSLTPAVLARIPTTARDALTTGAEACPTWVGVLNKAIIDVIEMGFYASRITAWYCATPHYWRTADWWATANDLAQAHGITRVFSWQLAAQGVECDYTFYNQPSFGGPADLCPPDLYPGVMRSGGTIGAITDQFVALSEAARAVHAGIDMKGRGYCDGTENPRGSLTDADEKSEIEVYVRTAKACQRRGLKFATLTPTALSDYLEVEEL